MFDSDDELKRWFATLIGSRLDNEQIFLERPWDGLVYLVEQMRGGRAMYVGRDGGYLIVGSAVDPRKHLEQFEAGDRTASITW
jgi:hypothetical protein